MELFVRAKSSLFINWLWSNLNPYELERVWIEGKEYHVHIDFFPEVKDKDPQTLLDRDLDTRFWDLNTSWSFSGNYIRPPKNIGKEITEPDDRLSYITGIPLGTIVIVKLDDERLQVRLEVDEPAMQKFFTQIANKVIGVWPVETRPETLRKLPDQIHASGNQDLDPLPDPKATRGKYGRHRSLTAEQVTDIVNRYYYYKEKGGTIQGYYDDILHSPHEEFTLETLKKWIHNPKFKNKKKPAHPSGI